MGPKMKKLSHKSQIFSIRQKTKLAESRFKIASGRATRASSLRGNTGSKFRIESYPLLASSQQVGAAAATTILQLEFMLVEQ